MTSLPLPLAVFVAGLISFLSPCVLPLVPGYVSLISGVGVEQLKLKEGELFRKVMLNSAAFILGFSIVFITLGAISTEVGQVLAQYKSLLARIAVTGNEEQLFSSSMACPDCGLDVPKLEPRSFSFNSAFGACPECHGLGSLYDLDPAKVIT